MTPGAIAILSLSMSTDAFAAAIGRGAAHRPTWPQALRAGAVFGVIEAITPLIGWGLGIVAAGMIERIDHWIAFFLLVAVGAHMAWHGLKGGDDEAAKSSRFTGPLALIATAIGTSIDAAAVGVGLAFAGVGAGIWIIALAIGGTTFVLTTVGMRLGRVVGARFGKVAEVIGGVALIGIGTLILAEHTGFLG